MVWDPTTPADTENINQGANRIRELKTDLITALSTEGIFPGPNTGGVPSFRIAPRYGNTASRPAPNPLFPGSIYFNTDTTTVQRDNGSAWQDVTFNPAGAGLITGSQIATGTITGANIAAGTISAGLTQVFMSYPTRSCFLAGTTSPVNATGDGTISTLVLNAPIFDQNSNISGNIFTAPVQGKYHFDAVVSLTGLTASHNAMLIFLTATSRKLVGQSDGNWAFATGSLLMSISGILDMNAGDTCQVQIQVSGGSKVVGYNGHSTVENSWFSGYFLF